jgi:hypothetical protein
MPVPEIYLKCFGLRHLRLPAGSVTLRCLPRHRAFLPAETVRPSFLPQRYASFLPRLPGLPLPRHSCFICLSCVAALFSAFCLLSLPRHTPNPAASCVAAQGTPHRARGTRYAAQSTRHRAHSTEHAAQSTQHRARGTEHAAQSMPHRVRRPCWPGAARITMCTASRRGIGCWP